MCGDPHAPPSHGGRADSATATEEDNNLEAFPWHLGIYDAHCHPIEQMDSIQAIPSMRAQTITVMATRSQDQDLAVQVASAHGIQGRSSLVPDSRNIQQRVVPCFGWHPWFSHQLYDDTDPSNAVIAATAKNDDAAAAAKRAHYDAVLVPSPSSKSSTKSENGHDDSSAFVEDLPTPMALSSFIASTRSRLERHPLALVGEVGLDKAFRLPRQWDDSYTREDAAAAEPRWGAQTDGSRKGRMLSPYRVSMAHQRAVLMAQLRLAGEMGRAVSVHGVQAHGVLRDTISALWKGHELPVQTRRSRKLGDHPDAEEEAFSATSSVDDEDTRKPPDADAGPSASASASAAAAAFPAANPQRSKPFPPKICLHSFSGSPEGIDEWLNPAFPAKIFFSFSTEVNLGTDAGEAKFDKVLARVPDARLLVESDLHAAGERMDEVLEKMYRRVCKVKGWGLDEGVRRIRVNYQEFIFG